MDAMRRRKWGALSADDDSRNHTSRYRKGTANMVPTGEHTSDQRRIATPSVKRDAAIGNWPSKLAGCPYLVGKLVDANNPTLRA